jgi:hypothetical protein
MTMPLLGMVLTMSHPNRLESDAAACQMGGAEPCCDATTDRRKIIDSQSLRIDIT